MAVVGIAVATVVFISSRDRSASEPGERAERRGSSEERPARERPSASPGARRVSEAEITAGLETCATRIESLGPAEVLTFSQLMRSCSGVFARTGCRDALAEQEFLRDRVADACREAYCDTLRPAPSFCTTELPTDAEFLIQFSRFAEAALSRDLRPVMGEEGAQEVAGLMASLIYEQSQTELEVMDDGE